MSVLTPPHHVLVDDVVVGLADVRIRHVLELGQSLKLVRSYEVVILLAGQDLENGLCVRIQIQFIVVSVLIW